ncbi:MAG TPA: cytochrome c [Rhizomicrobium sp.]|nr:cytochrome c [Rhizomicrobium sp.]
MRSRFAIPIAAAAVTLAGLAASGCIGLASASPSGMGSHIGAQDQALIARGRYLATVGDCQACHTDNASHGAPYAGGKPVETPFGVVLGANITPDRETGIGAWSDDEFDAALRKGIMPDGGHLYPAMPYPFYAKMTRDDTRALRAYLNTIAPQKRFVDSNRLPFPFNIRALMAAWNFLYFSPGVYAPDKTKPVEWNRGAFLVEGPGHCGACHTPKTWLGGDETSRALRGGVIQGWFASDITGNPDLGTGRWSIEDIVKYLKTGHNRFSAATGSMAETVEDSTSNMSLEDLHAIAVYLKTVPYEQENHRTIAADDTGMKAGKAIYVDSCSACHAMNGEGSANLFPSLAQSPNVRSRDATSLIRITLQGARSVATAGEPTAPGMPTYAWLLNDQQIADVLTYIRNSWGAAEPAVTADQVRDERAALAEKGD